MAKFSNAKTYELEVKSMIDQIGDIDMEDGEMDAARKESEELESIQRDVENLVGTPSRSGAIRAAARLIRAAHWIKRQ